MADQQPERYRTPDELIAEISATIMAIMAREFNYDEYSPDTLLPSTPEVIKACIRRDYRCLRDEGAKAGRVERLLAHKYGYTQASVHTIIHRR